MDVSRIEAISPKQIDWRKLTSKEIIKYDNQGIAVPDVYLQWAKNFLSDVNSTDKDETTYEMATMSENKTSKSKPSKSVDKSEDGATSTTQVSQTEDSEKTDETDDNTEKSEEEMTASEKRAKMQKEDGIIKTAKTFINTSKQNKAECKAAEETISNAQSQSSDEIAALDSYMNNLLSEIDDLKSQIQTEQNRKDSKSLKIIKKLNQQIKIQGQAGQTAIAGKEASLQAKQTSVDDFSALIDSTTEYGSETIDIGQDLLKFANAIFIYPLVLGIKATVTGGDAIDQANDTRDVQSEAHKQIQSDISNISGYKNDLQQESGVRASVTQNSESNGNAEQNEETADSTNSKQTQAKDDTKSNAPELDESVKAHSSLDEILKRKLRKGENIEA